MKENLPKYSTEVYDIIFREFRKSPKDISLTIKSELELDVDDIWIQNFKYQTRQKFKLLAGSDELFLEEIKKSEIDTQQGLYELYTLLKNKIEAVNSDDRKDIEILLKVSNQILMLLNTEMKRKGEYQIGINKREVSVVQINETIRHEMVSMVDRIESDKTGERAIITNPILIEMFRKKKKVIV